MQGNEDKCIQNFVEKWKERDNLEALVQHGGVLLKWMLKKLGGRGLDSY